MSETTVFIFTCDVCRNKYQHGPHRYEGHRLELYGDLFCCDTCWDSNWDGWAPRYENVLLEYLNSKGIPPPARNLNGLLPRN
jgi:hypothetical protein